MKTQKCNNNDLIHDFSISITEELQKLKPRTNQLGLQIKYLHKLYRKDQGVESIELVKAKQLYSHFLERSNKCKWLQFQLFHLDPKEKQIIENLHNSKSVDLNLKNAIDCEKYELAGLLKEFRKYF